MISLWIGEHGNSIDSEQNMLMNDKIIYNNKVIDDKISTPADKFSIDSVIDIMHKSMYQSENTCWWICINRVIILKYKPLTFFLSSEKKFPFSWFDLSICHRKSKAMAMRSKKGIRKAYSLKLVKLIKVW